MSHSSMFLLSDTCFLAPENMAGDVLMLGLCERMGFAFLRFYSWAERSATCGYSQSALGFSKESLRGIERLVRRPVGGGLVIHEQSDITYALAVPARHEFFLTRPAQSYAILHKTIASCLADFDCACVLNASDTPHLSGSPQCFRDPSKNDLMLGLRKLAGAAQRRTRGGLLVQGSIKPPEKLFKERELIQDKLAKAFAEMLDSRLERAEFSDFIRESELKVAARNFKFLPL